MRIRSVGKDVADAERSSLRATTRTRSVSPTSPGCTTYVRPVAWAIALQPAPSASHRRQVNAYERFDPFHDPGLAVSVAPTTGVPEIVGRAVFVTAPGRATTAVALDAADALPSSFRAVTITRIRRPASPPPSTYEVVVAPEIAAQLPPSARPPSTGQRTHWNSKLAGSPLHVPRVAVSVRPTVGVPEIRGSLVFTGAAALAASLPFATTAPSASAATATVVPSHGLRLWSTPSSATPRRGD